MILTKEQVAAEIQRLAPAEHWSAVYALVVERLARVEPKEPERWLRATIRLEVRKLERLKDKDRKQRLAPGDRPDRLIYREGLDHEAREKA